jgi:hypothetical protein
MSQKDLDEAKRTSHAMIRAKYDSLPPAERERYAARGRKMLGAEMFDGIISSDPQLETVSEERAAMRRLMDQKMGLVARGGGITRSAIQLSVSVLGPSPSASQAPRGALQPTPPAPAQRPAPQHQPPPKTAEQREMDRRMGLTAGGFRITRTAHSLTFSMAASD